MNRTSPVERSQSPSYSFGVSREKYEKVFSMTKPFIAEDDLPGPGQYQVGSFIQRMVERAKEVGKHQKDHIIKPERRSQLQLKPTMKSNEIFLNFEEARNSVVLPGPGQYPVQRKSEINPVGQYFVSKFISSGAPKFTRDHRNYFLSISKLQT